MSEYEAESGAGTSDDGPAEKRLQIPESPLSMLPAQTERGGIVYARNTSENEDSGEITPPSYIMRELLPEHPQLNFRDLRLNFRTFDKKDYVSVYNRHTNELLRTLPHEDFNRIVGRINVRRKIHL
ncbi:hypothetical protein CHS0354_018518 [Potamilus streckersoni]|uniref:Uncharacterized protein n=1 Tax=Potamilus streckersoni TaxID=2493646 RepID=A0AAE0TAR2_9BIVA|nr:hypothetical protein CHS0354_018518 [Potamilus streckersoni]